jgi:hypothetical protein
MIDEPVTQYQVEDKDYPSETNDDGERDGKNSARDGRPSLRRGNFDPSRSATAAAPSTVILTSDCGSFRDNSRACRIPSRTFINSGSLPAGASATIRLLGVTKSRRSYAVQPPCAFDFFKLVLGSAGAFMQSGREFMLMNGTRGDLLRERTARP